MEIKAFKMSFDSSISNKMTEKEFVDLHMKSNIISNDLKKREVALKEVYKLAKDMEEKNKAKVVKEESKVTKETDKAK